MRYSQDKSKIINTRVSQRLYDDIHKLATMQKSTMSELMREQMERYLSMAFALLEESSVS